MPCGPGMLMYQAPCPSSPEEDLERLTVVAELSVNVKSNNPLAGLELVSHCSANDNHM